MLSLYIHIPFCHHKCGYCSFNVIPLHQIRQTSPSVPLLDRKRDDHKDESPSLGGEGLGGGIISGYLRALHKQIDEFSEKIGDQEIRTIYFGGGTPSTIGSEEMIRLIDHIGQVRNLEYLEELSIEINPDPEDQMLELIQTISKRYQHFPRVRFSIGIQSFDNEVLEESGRQYNFQSCVQFLRKLVPIKMDHNIFNFDFIAFGKFNQTRKGDLQLRDPARLDFFANFVHSGFADSFSLYTLELFEGSEWFNQQIANHNHEKAGFGLKKYGTDDDVYAEFELLNSILLDAGYQRYEISNYSKAGSNSIHNRVYRSMDERLGLGTGATSHLKKDNLEKILPHNNISEGLSSGGGTTKDLSPLYSENNISSLASQNKINETEILPPPSSEGQKENIYSGHFSIVPDIKRFVEGVRIDDKKTELLAETDYLKEKFIMGMRTMEGVQLADSNITTVLVSHREEKVTLFVEQELCRRDHIRLKLTDSGMDVYNSIISELLA